MAVEQDVIRRLSDIERRLDRMAAARVLSPPISNQDIATLAQIALSKLSTNLVADRLVLDNGSAIVTGQLANAHIPANTVGLNKLLTNGVASRLVKDTGAGITTGQLVDAEVTLNAIQVNKLWAAGTANRVAATLDGSNMAMQQVNTQMLASLAVTSPAAQTPITSTTLGAQAATVLAGSPTGLTTVAGTNCVLVGVWLNWYNTAAGHICTIYAAHSGVAQAEIGTQHSYVANHYQDFFGFYLMPVAASTAYVFSSMLAISGGSVFIRAGRLIVLEFRR